LEALEIKRTLPMKKVNLQPTQILAIGFAVLIIIGSLLLMLPIASKDGQSLSFIDALFTATSAVCITGLVVVDTATHFSLFGQLVILILIQIGGLGIMTAATLVFLILGKKITLRERLVMQEALHQLNLSGLVKLTKYIIAFTFAIEGIGAVLLSFTFIKDYGLAKGIYYSIFHAVSAFNNAGFDLMGDFNSLTFYVENPLVNLVIMTLVVVGGLGFSVIYDIFSKRNIRNLSLNSKVVLSTTAILLFTGFVLFYILEYSNPKTLGNLNPKGKILAAAFHSVTPRSGGFVTLNIKDMTTASKYFTMLLMFIGASPGSTGGGIKVTTFAIIVMIINKIFAEKDDVELYGKRIPIDTIFKTMAIATISIILLATCLFGLTLTERLDFLEISFEAFSAIGTVGLSLGATPKLSNPGKILLMIAMFIGRLGHLSMIYILGTQKKKASMRYPEERILIG